jgi:hypothetical protein
VSRLFGRESWDLVLAAAMGLPVKGLERKDMPGAFGYPSPLSPPVSSSERAKVGPKLRSQEKKAKEALVAEAGRSDGAAAAAAAVTAVVALCGERHKTLDEEFAPRLAAAKGAVLAACPTLRKKLDDYLERSKVLAMHDARAQVLGGKLGAVAGAVAGLTPTQRVQYDAAVDSNNESEIARLLDLGAAANGKSGALASVACLGPEDKIEYDSALAEGRMGEVERLLEKARSLFGAKGGEAHAGLLKPRLSEGERKDPAKHIPSRIRGEFHCKWNCEARASTLDNMNKHYRRVTEALKEGRKTPCECTGPLPSPALCAMGGAVDTAGTAAAAGSSA